MPKAAIHTGPKGNPFDPLMNGGLWPKVRFAMAVSQMIFLVGIER